MTSEASIHGLLAIVLPAILLLDRVIGFENVDLHASSTGTNSAWVAPLTDPAWD